MSNTTNNKRIAKNTAMLYFRMLLIMGVTLYTTRIVLRMLGVEDFGIYNVVGGIVNMASFLSSSMSSAVQRFLAFELGKNNLKQLQRVFAMSINIHSIIAIAVLILAETIGLWFVNYKLEIPQDRMIAANWVYQFSILAFLINIISVPYNAAILAYEKMNVFAYISIVEVFLKLAAVFALGWFSLDKLPLYAFFILLTTLMVRVLYGIYLKRNIKECKYSLFWDKKLFNTLINFAGWNLWGNMASVTYNQGINILLNIFFGPVINTARAIAFQVNAALNSFISNFQMALKPQIIKSYATNDKEYMHSLVFSGAKYSFFLMMVLCAPIILSTKEILTWWLGTVPNYTVIFCQLVLIESLINSISGTLMAGAQASGKIKKYQMVVGGLLMLILPISYLFLKLGFSPETTLYISISICSLTLLARLWIIGPLIKISKFDFFKEVFVPIGLVTITVFIAVILMISKVNDELSSLLFMNIILIIIILIMIYLFGLKKTEKKFVVLSFQKLFEKYI